MVHPKPAVWVHEEAPGLTQLSVSCLERNVILLDTCMTKTLGNAKISEMRSSTFELLILKVFQMF